MDRNQTKGEYRVGASFNPGGNETVQLIKQKAAELIDLIECIEAVQASETSGMVNGERARLKALAQTAIEDGAMWAVKAATKPAPEKVEVPQA